MDQQIWTPSRLAEGPTSSPRRRRVLRDDRRLYGYLPDVSSNSLLGNQQSRALEVPCDRERIEHPYGEYGWDYSELHVS